jgi:hypothetical protein
VLFANVHDEHLPDGCEHYHEIEADARRRQVGLWSKDAEKLVKG